MKTLVYGAVALLGLAGSASASVVFHGGTAPLSVVVDAQLVSESDTGSGLRGANLRYDNWTNPPSVLNGLFNTGANEIADDLHMTNLGVQLLCDMGVNVANTAAAGGPNLTGGTGEIRFYDFGTGNFISGFGFNLPALATAPGGSNRLSFGLNALVGLGIYLPNDVYASMKYVTTTGIVLADVGMQLRGPIAVGTSSDNLYNITAGGTAFSYGGAPLANTGLRIHTNVPAPGSLALLGLGGLLAARRRR